MIPTLRKYLPPITLPVIFFALIVCLGAILLHSGSSHGDKNLSWTDAVFTATSAVCVTGLTVVDTGSFFNGFGQGTILLLIQVGGLGIMTFTSLLFYLWRQRVSLTDQIAVGQAILRDSSSHLGSFLKQMLLMTLLIEIGGALLLFLAAPSSISPYSAVFHAVSAFCNAGFALHPDSLVAWKGNWPVNLIVMALIIIGGLGFSVLLELRIFFAGLLGKSTGRKKPPRLSWYALTVIKTSLALILAGWAAIFLAEFIGFQKPANWSESILAALFQSVTCRTAGFNTLDIGNMTNISLLLMIVLMFIGGAPGSCAGGIKVSTFRVFWAFIISQLQGRNQVIVGRFAISGKDVSRTLILIIFTAVVIFSATLLLSATEGGNIPHPQARGQLLEILFEVVSAMGTVGLSTGLTAKLSTPGKWIVILLMFIGRLGPLVFLAVLQELRRDKLYLLPEENIMIG
ncbi:MAG: potassium transporter TrkH [Proteobacteria bacterium]|nr:potassium transporter TrkH [Pseudomonadota bacterium]MBU1737140.1 potassium transporter TrkH [Pseudomonadota bacterium]